MATLAKDRGAETPSSLRPRLRPLDPAPEPDAAATEAAAAELPAEAAGIDDADALRIFRRAAQLDPHDPDYHFILGQALYRAGRYAEAAAASREAVQLLGREPAYHCALGAALWELRRYEEAEAAFREAVRLGPDDTRALNGLGCALTQLRREREALEVFETALARDGRQADVHGNLALALWGLGRSAAALRSVRKAIELQPEDAELHRGLGTLLSSLGRREEAVNAFRLAARHRPADAERHLDLAEALHAAGRDADAEAALDQALRLDPAALAGRPGSQEVGAALRLRRLRASLASESPAPARRGRLSRWLHAREGRGRWRRPRPLTLLLMAGVAALGYALWQLAPPYFSRYLLEDDIAEVARAPVRDDADILDRLAHVVRRRGLDAYIDRSSFEIQTHPKWRLITCRYQVPVRILPGVTHTLRFHIEVERPYFLLQEAPGLAHQP